MAGRTRVRRARPLVMHLTTADISLELLLGPQLSAFADAGYEVVGVSAPGPFVDDVVARGIEHVALDHATRAMDLRSDLAALAELVTLFRRRRPDIVHTHNPKTGVYGRLAAAVARVPHIVNTVHGLYATPEDRLVRRVAVYGAERVAATCSDLELVQNPEDIVTMRALRIPEQRIRLLGNGVDLTRFGGADHTGGADDRGPDGTAAEIRASVRSELGIDPDAVVVGAVGRLVREKGYVELFQAWDTVKAADPSAVLVVVGPHEPDKSDALDAALVAAATANGIRFLGMRDDVERIYRALDVYALLSYREGFPRSAMEAAASGLPIVATDIRGCRQVVDDGVTGLLVPRGDADSAGRALTALVTDEGRRRGMSVAATARAVEHFDQQRVIDITLAAYRDLLGPAAPSLQPASQPSRQPSNGSTVS